MACQKFQDVPPEFFLSNFFSCHFVRYIKPFIALFTAKSGGVFCFRGHLLEQFLSGCQLFKLHVYSTGNEHAARALIRLVGARNWPAFCLFYWVVPTYSRHFLAACQLAILILQQHANFLVNNYYFFFGMLLEICLSCSRSSSCASCRWNRMGNKHPAEKEILQVKKKEKDATFFAL
jgi:hypothetical protein